MMIRQCMLTTIDNPYDYFEQFDKWYLFDVSHGYNTCSLLARLAKTSNNLSDAINCSEIERVCDEILKFDHQNIYKKVYDS